MNYLFYVGIIIPTLITILLFLIFIYCWFLQKARKEVLTKKYDPHGKMRRLGISMDPPPPPAYCRMDDSLLPDIGEDNIAYDVSRSPSTEQEGRGRPMYHTYHDSGISAGLSPSQESEPRPGLAYRTCPDSGISGFGPLAQPAACRGCCQAEEEIHRQVQPQQHQVYGDQIQIHSQQQQQQYHQQQEQALPQAVLHHNLVQASVHPTHGVCYGDDMTHPQSPLHYNPPPIHPNSLSLAHYDDRQINLVAHIHQTPPHSSTAYPHSRLPSYPDSPGQLLYDQNGQLCYHSNQVAELQQQQQNIGSHPSYGRYGQDNVGSPTTTDLQQAGRAMPLASSVNFHPQTSLSPDTNNQQYAQNTSPSSSSSSPTKPLRHSYRDSGVSDIVQSNSNSADRPDSQASQSSTTDSEDSGFRSSHCAAHHNARLNKQGNPLLKPLRRTKNNKSKNKLPRTTSSNSDDSQTNGATALITLNPQNLPSNMDNSNVIQNTSLMEVDLAHRPTRILKQNTNVPNSIPNDRVTKSNPTTSQPGVALTFHDGSPIHSTSQHSPTRENWPPQSTNDQETVVKQNIDLNDISTHLSWKYLQDLSCGSSANMTTSNAGMVLQPCHQGVNVRPNQSHQMNQEPHTMEMFGYSVV